MSDKDNPELEENMLISWFESKFGFLKPHYKTIATVGGLAILAFILGTILVRANRDSYAAQWNELSLSMTNWAYDSKTSHLTDMAKERPDQPASLWALQIAGDAELEEGLNKLGNPLRASDPNKPDESGDLRATAIRHLKKAKENYQQILDSKGRRSPLLEHRTVFAMARVSESLGEWEDAKKFYTQLIDQAPDCEFIDLAKRGVARTNDTNLKAFYDEFRTTEMGVAPGVALPDRPDISFPDFDTPATDDGDADPAPKPADDGEAKSEDPPMTSDESAEGGDDAAADKAAADKAAAEKAAAEKAAADKAAADKAAADKAAADKAAADKAAAEKAAAEKAAAEKAAAEKAAAEKAAADKAAADKAAADKAAAEEKAAESGNDDKKEDDKKEDEGDEDDDNSVSMFNFYVGLKR